MTEALSLEERRKVRHGLAHGAVCRKCHRGGNPNTSVRTKQVSAPKTSAANRTVSGIGDRERSVSEMSGKGNALRHP